MWNQSSLDGNQSLPLATQKDVRVIDNCFVLIRTHQYGIGWSPKDPDSNDDDTRALRSALDLRSLQYYTLFVYATYAPNIHVCNVIVYSPEVLTSAEMLMYSTSPLDHTLAIVLTFNRTSYLLHIICYTDIYKIFTNKCSCMHVQYVHYVATNE